MIAASIEKKFRLLRIFGWLFEFTRTLCSLAVFCYSRISMCDFSEFPLLNHITSWSLHCWLNCAYSSRKCRLWKFIFISIIPQHVPDSKCFYFNFCRWAVPHWSGQDSETWWLLGVFRSTNQLEQVLAGMGKDQRRLEGRARRYRRRGQAALLEEGQWEGWSRDLAEASQPYWVCQEPECVQKASYLQGRQSRFFLVHSLDFSALFPSLIIICLVVYDDDMPYSLRFECTV